MSPKFFLPVRILYHNPETMLSNTIIETKNGFYE